MASLERLINRQRSSNTTFRRIKMRNHLNADTLYSRIREDFDKVLDHRAANTQISLCDALMSEMAMFCLKDASLLAFERRRQDEPDSLHEVFSIKNIPSDSQMRTILDPVSVRDIRRPFRTVFTQLQRDKVFEKMTFFDGFYLLALDGTGVYTSEKISSPYCQSKRKRNGNIEHYQQMVAGATVHLDHSEFIPTCPEMIVKQDGSTKNDCERNATKRYLDDFRPKHPHLKVIVVEDALASNAPHIQELLKHDLRYILGAKPTDHEYLYQLVDEAIEIGRINEFHQADPEKAGARHYYRHLIDIPINKTSKESLCVNLLEYWQADDMGNIERRFAWVTDITLTKKNVYDIMQAGRVRWRIENEPFNTLKKQGYNLGHNYGLGKEHLSAVFAHLMMLAFLIDQVQQMCCPLFQVARAKCQANKYLWENIRNFFHCYVAPSMAVILHCIVNGIPKRKVEIQWE
ncbi:transposase [Desulfogranum marinum]|uniref:transposase n=1 Tax=Desulfogranum marinum TaxID=453220 RepID=UPI0029C76A0B|nr:transposase [Desulfogranum marinum]